MGVLLHDLAQVHAGTGQGIGQCLVQPPPLPVGEEQEHREDGDQAAHQGIEQARQEQAIAIADLIEAEQHHQGDRGRGQGVAGGTVDEEHHPGDHGEQRLDDRVGEQVEQGPTHRQADRGAEDSLHQLAPGCTVVGLAHEQRGEDDPVALGRVDQVHHAVADRQRQRQAQGMAEQQRGRRQLGAQARPHILQRAWRAVEQAAVAGVGQAVRIAGSTEQAVQRRQVGSQRPQRAQQAAPGRVVLHAQVFQRGVQVLQGFGEAAGQHEWLAQADRAGQFLAGRALLAQQALAAEHHVAVEKRLGQRVVRVVRGTDPFMDVLGQEVQLEVAADLGVRLAVAHPVQDDFLGCVERRHHLAVLLGQLQAPGLDVEGADRFEQAGLELEVAAQLEEQLGQALLHRLVGKQRLPQHRQQAVPGCTGHQQHRLMPEIGDRATALVDADHGVDRQNQGRRGNRPITFAQGAEHRQAEGGQGEGDDKENGVGEQQFDRQRGDGETHQRHCQSVEAALPAVIGFGQGAGDNPQEQRDQQSHFILIPAQSHGAGQGDEHPHAVTEFIQRPKPAQRLTERGR
ncbi:hypothetical protein D9M71_326230 [compost metagenome]